MHTSIFLTAGFVARQALWLGVAEAHSSQTVCGKAVSHENLLNCSGTPAPQLSVVLRRTAVVTVTLENDNQIRELPKDLLASRRHVSECAALACSRRLLAQSEVDVWGCLSQTRNDPVRCGLELLPFRRGSRRPALRRPQAAAGAHKGDNGDERRTTECSCSNSQSAWLGCHDTVRANRVPGDSRLRRLEIVCGA